MEDRSRASKRIINPFYGKQDPEGIGKQDVQDFRNQQSRQVRIREHMSHSTRKYVIQ